MRFIEMMALVVLAQWATGFAGADEPAPNPSVTQQELAQIMTTSPPKGTPSPALPIHDLSEADIAALRGAGGARLINGELWKSETPERREQHLKNLKENAAPGTVFLIEVPSGNVWAFQPGALNANLNLLIKVNIVHPWYPYQIMGLPIAAAGYDRLDRGQQNFVAGFGFKF